VPENARFKGVLIMALSALFGVACERPVHAAGDLPKPNTDLPAQKDNADAVAYFAGGCFWCTEAVFEQLAGVKDVVSGYSGGAKETANYKAVCGGDTGHAEAIKITYDPSKITYGELLRVFFTTHNPTTKNRQGNDVGSQYRSAIFYQSEDEKKVAEAYIKQLNDAKAFDDPIVTSLEPYKSFYIAEDYHQDYARLNPNQGYIRAIALPKVQKVFEHFQDKVKKPEEQKK
jgi:peptide-methionine (S)-S-oxide reductase